MPTPHPIALLSLITPWFDTAAAHAALHATRARLSERHRVLGPDAPIVGDVGLDAALAALRQAPDAPQALVLQLGTFPDGAAVARAAEALGVPIVVHSLPEPSLATSVPLNSLCGANMATYTLTALALPHAWVHADPRDVDGGERLLQHVQAATALRRLRGARVALIGHRAPGFYPCAYDEFLLRRRFGIEIAYVDPHEVRRRVDPARRRAAKQTAFPTMGGGELSAAAVASMEAHHHALAEAIAAHGTTTVAIRDWPELETFDPNVPGGLWPALGWVQDDGVDLAPEGDVHGALTGAIATALGRDGHGDRPFFTDVSAWDDAASTLTLWHYAGPTAIARDPHEIRFGTDGRNVEFTIKPGRGHLLRLGLQHGTLRLLAIDVEILDRRVTLGRAAGLARTLRTPAGDVVRRMLDGGWEHHVTLVYGERGEAIRAFAQQAGLPLTAL